MPYRVQQFVNGEIYHIVLRALDDNLVFCDIDDYYRGIFSIFEFNDDKPVKIRERRKARLRFKKAITRPTCDGIIIIPEMPDKRELLVEVLAFCFMPNHIHLLLRQLQEGGLRKFMVKFASGYARYFNQKHHRKGYVFQNRFKDVHIANENQLRTVFVYLHVNPLSLCEPGWKEKGIKDLSEAIDFLEHYKWSSYQDYLGVKNFPSVTKRDFLLEIMGGSKGCKDSVDDWLEYKRELLDFSEFE